MVELSLRLKALILVAFVGMLRQSIPITHKTGGRNELYRMKLTYVFFFSCKKEYPNQVNQLLLIILQWKLILLRQ